MAIETALALTVLVVAFAAVMEIVQASYSGDRIARAARSAARALALDPAADACAAIRRELHLADDFDCGTAWELKVDRGVSPSTLPATLDASATAGTGDLVLVRIGWQRESFSFGEFIPAVNAEEDPEAEEEPEEVEADTATVSVMAIGLARCELERCEQDTP